MTGPKSRRRWCCATRPSTWRCSRPRAAASCARGLGYRYCDVGAVLNVTSRPPRPGRRRHAGAAGRGQAASWSRSPRTPRCSTPTTSYTLKMADHTQAKHLCYVTMNPDHPLVREHIRPGQRAVVLEQGLNGDQIVIYDNGSPPPAALDPPDPGDRRGQGAAQRRERDVRRGDGLCARASRSRRSARAADLRQHLLPGPGRMNIFDEHGFKVILDYGHNAAAVGAMVELVERLNPLGQRHRLRHLPGRPARRGHRRGREDRGRAVRPLHLPRATTTRAAARPTRCRGCWRGGLLGRGAAERDHSSPTSEEVGRHGARDGAAERPGADLRRQRSPGAGSRSSTSAPKQALPRPSPERLVTAAGFDVPRATACSATSAGCGWCRPERC